MIFSRFLWVTPFATFIIGYFFISFISTRPILTTPELAGQGIDKAAILLSQKNLNIRIIGHKNEPDLSEGTIISQTPSAGTAIKEHQAVYLVIACKPAPQQIPDLAHKTISDATKLIESQQLHLKIVPLATDYQNQHCIAQYPCPGMSITDQTIIVYACENQKPAIMPNFKNRSVEEVISFLQLHGCSAEILHATITQPAHQCSKCLVLDQRPMPGTLIIMSPDKPLKVQLQVG